MKQYDLIVYIGRFQPFHNAHEYIVRTAQQMADNVLILIGSSNVARSIKNPFTADERYRMIANTLSDFDNEDGSIQFINDYVYDDNLWIEQVGTVVNNYAGPRQFKKIGVIGHDKDHSSFYLNSFPQWDFIGVSAYPEKGDTIDATQIRQLLYTSKYHFIKGVVSKETYKWIDEEFLHTDEYNELVKEHIFVENYKKSWSLAPYPPIFVTVDSVVYQSGHVLLIQRGGFPGRGQWALPGGFIDPHERLEYASVRELREETRLKVPEKVLQGSIVAREVFDDPNRSTRGRTITHAYLFQLDDSESLPRVKGSDDAIAAKWFSLAEINDMATVMYEEHWHIIKHMLTKLKRKQH